MKIANSIFEDGRVGAINELLKQPLPVSDSYRLMKFAKELKEKEEVYSSAKLSIFRKYGKEKDGSITIEKSKQEKANKELEELLSLEEKYEFDKKIVLPKDVILSAVQIMQLEDLVEVK
jgi:hypothetical protein